MELSSLHLCFPVSEFIVSTAVVLFVVFFFFGALWAVPFQVLPSTLPALQFSPYAADTAMILFLCDFKFGDHVTKIQAFVVPHGHLCCLRGLKRHHWNVHVSKGPWIIPLLFCAVVL